MIGNVYLILLKINFKNLNLNVIEMENGIIKIMGGYYNERFK